MWPPWFLCQPQGTKGLGPGLDKPRESNPDTVKHIEVISSPVGTWQFIESTDKSFGQLEELLDQYNKGEDDNMYIEYNNKKT